MVCGLLERDGGTVEVAGRPVDVGTAAAKAAIGYVPQELAIYPDLTARENLRFFGELYGLGGAELKARIDEVLEIIGLDDRADERTDQYSGGMKRRLNIGIGLLHRPSLLVLDEPTVGVDPQSRNAILVERRGAGPAGHGDPVHDPLHGGGRAPLRPGRDHRRGRDPAPRARAGSWSACSGERDRVELGGDRRPGGRRGGRADRRRASRRPASTRAG